MIDESLEGILFGNIFENDSISTCCDLINLEEVDFSNYTFDKIFYFSFMNCKKIKSIELPETIKIIELYCFTNCEKLESVILHGVEEIKEWVFKECISLKYLFISNEIKKINEYAFNAISKEQKIIIICPDRFYNYFKERFGKDFETNNSVEEGKEIAINEFLHKLEKFATKIGAKLKVGFSDDDVNTVKHMTNFFKEKDLDVAVDYYIFNTANKGKERVKI